jgi:hypothetical protein
MDHETSDEVQLQLFDATGEIYDAYISPRREPSDQTIDAFAALFDCSHNEFRKLFARRAHR